jgi:anti-anti-sigma factor
MSGLRGTSRYSRRRGCFSEARKRTSSRARSRSWSNKKLLINLGQTTFLNSVSLGVLIGAHSSYAKREAEMKLCAVDKKIQNIFVVTKLSLVFDVYESCEEATKSFQK